MRNRETNIAEPSPTIFVNELFIFNGKVKKGFKVICSAQKHLDKSNQPNCSDLDTIFKDIAKTLHNQKKEPDEIDQYGDAVYYAYSCTSEKLGFSTDHRSTKFKEDSGSEYMLAFHHSIRTKRQYEKSFDC